MTTESTNNIRELVYLAGLLHDIGKFDKNIESLWKNSPFYQQSSATVQAIVEKADAWATAIDQQNNDVIDVNQRLKNLFGDVLLDGVATGDNYFGFTKLCLEATVVLQKESGDLDTLRLGFAADFDRLPKENSKAFSESLYHLLRQYTWCLPASGGADFKSISLFHHLKLTGAFTQCLYDAHIDGAIDDKPVQLLCVDLSGIQTFIYSIGSKYAAKSLKGRSFSLQLLLDTIARKLIRDTQTTSSHLVYSSGGKFFMLLPHTVKINAILYDTEKAIQQAIWDAYQGNLFVCFGRVPFDYDPKTRLARFERSTVTKNEEDWYELGALWAEVTRKAAEQKSQKNKALILDKNYFTKLFRANDKGGAEHQCPVTGWEGELAKTNDGEAEVHKTVKTQIDIGAKLQNADFITFGEGEFFLANNLENFDLNRRTTFTANAEYCQIMQSGQNNDFLAGKSYNHIVRSFRFYGGSKQAKSVHSNNLPKNFEELAGTVREKPDDDNSPIWQEECTGNYRRLAVLRMDVDSLGNLFTQGFKKNNATFSAYATLSGLLDWFFSGYLNTIRDEYADWVNIVYSGGDDVFAVGRWDKIIAFADHIQRDFKAFTGRTELTISAGIVLMRPRYPIGKAADQAGEAEGLAKDHVYNNLPKNAICLFNLAVNWDEEWPFVKEYHDKFVKWLLDGTISKGILQKLFSYYDIYVKSEAKRKAAEKREEPDDKPDLSWKWNAAYTLSRHRTDSNKVAIDDLKALLFIEINNKIRRFEALAMAMRWAELTVRDYPKHK